MARMLVLVSKGGAPLTRFELPLGACGPLTLFAFQCVPTLCGGNTRHRVPSHNDVDQRRRFLVRPACRRRSCSESASSFPYRFFPGTGTEITVVADAASVSSDAGSIHHEATLIGALVPTTYRCRRRSSRASTTDRRSSRNTTFPSTTAPSAFSEWKNAGASSSVNSLACIRSVLLISRNALAVC